MNYEEYIDIDLPLHVMLYVNIYFNIYPGKRNLSLKISQIFLLKRFCSSFEEAVGV